MAKRKSTKRKTTIYKIYTQNKRSGNTNPTKNRGWTQVLPNGKQFQLHYNEWYVAESLVYNAIKNVSD
jgi:hypothetical protein